MRKNKLQPECFYWSASRMNLWNDCQTCFWMKYIDKIKPTREHDYFDYGRAIHETIEAMGKGENAEVLKHGVLEMKDFGFFLKFQEHISKYQELKDRLKMKNGANEVEFLVETQMPDPFREGRNLLLYGFFDRVEYSPSTKTVPQAISYVNGKLESFDKVGKPVKNFRIMKLTEFKTKCGRWSLRDIRNNYQFAIYQYAVLKLNKGRKFFFQLINFVKNGKLDIQIEKANLTEGKLADQIKNTEDVIENIQNKKVNPKSTCGFFSPYNKEDCENYFII